MMDVSTPSRPTAAIVAWQALPVILPRVKGAIGGMETAAWTFARGLAQHTDYAPTIVVRGVRRTAVQEVDAVRLSVHVDRWQPLRRDVSQCLDLSPRIRLKRFRPRLIWQVPLLAATWPWRSRDPAPMQPDPRLADLDPDIWIAMGVSRESAAVIARAKQAGRPAVLMIRSGADLDPGYAADPQYRSAYGEPADACLFAIRKADQIVCQSQHQLDLLNQHFGRQGVLLRNPIDLSRWTLPASSGRGGVLWIGRYERFAKRIHLAIQVAALCPEIPFRMIVAPSDPKLRRTIRANSPNNIRWIDRVPFQDMPALFASSRLLLCTSAASAEGFPNVLLQAAATQTPVVSLDDFDGFIRNCRAGVVCGDVHAAADRIRQLYSGQITAADPHRVDECLRTGHDLPVVSRQLAEILTATLQTHQHGQAAAAQNNV